MAHEVVKTINGRGYRYRVESFRDPETGKSRGKWTYLGKVHDAREVVARPRSDTRERLIEALERLLEREEYAAITAGKICVEAGLAHGTFYRYFNNKQAALRAAVERIRQQADAERSTFEGELGNQDGERRRLRAWVESVFRRPADRIGLLRAAYSVAATDESFRMARASNHARTIDSLAQYLTRLSAAGLASVESPAELAWALLRIVDGVFRIVALERVPLDEAAIAGAVDVFDRAVFCNPTPVALDRGRSNQV